MDRDSSGAIIVIACMMVGMVLAAILKGLNDAGILVDELVVNTISITDVMIVVILFWTIIGVALAVARR